MGLIEIIMTVCSLSHPGACEEKHLQFIDEGASLMQCIMQAPTYLATWSDEHPGLEITKWRCAFPSEEDQPI